MAKRMRFSVVGLPHYVIWHLYEPSADDIKHMEREEEERKTKEAAEKADKEHQAKVMENYDDPKDQWEGDKRKIDEAKKAVEKSEKPLVGGAAGPHAHAGEDEAVAPLQDAAANVNPQVR